MQFAPVLIPTLNRFELFKQCIESLNNNHNACNTDVYVSVDFPASDKYVEGHKRICDYLKTTQFQFKSLNVIYQKKNLGVSGPNSNSSFLTQLVKDKYDRWIKTEDDNLFSVNFIDFMNEALDKFESDDTVFSVCGYSFYYNIKFGDNNFYRQNADFNAWGYGIWKHKLEKFRKTDCLYLKKIVYNPRKLLKIWRVSYQRLNSLIYLSQKKYFKRGDNFNALYMINEGMYQIMPKVSKVRNLGWEGSGLHCIGFNDEVVSKHSVQIIDEDDYVSLKGTGWEYLKYNQNIIAREDFQQVSKLKTIIKLFIRLLKFWA